MKKILIAFALTYSFSLFITNGAKAQTSDRAEVAKLNLEPAANLSSKPVPSENLSPVSDKTIKNFKKTVKFSANERWFKCDDGASLVKYEDQKGIRCRSDFDKKGNWTATTRYYSEKQLPKDVRAQVKSVYYDFTITTVEEITFANHLVYIIHMSDETTWLNIRICDGEMDEFQRFAKARP